jgi:CHASE2 domain-containing sensor protein/tRNA A-37 threonylcarbamoyl transferase component Bud32
MKSLILSRKGLVILIMLLMLVSAGRSGMFNDYSYALYDKIRMFEPPRESKVLVVAVDEKSLARIGEYPVAFETHMRLLENLISAGVTLVGYVGLHSLNRVDEAGENTLASPPIAGQQLDELTRNLRNQGQIIAGIPFVSAADDQLQGALPGYLLQNSLPNNKTIKIMTARPAYPMPESAGGPAASFASVPVANDAGRTVRSVPLFVEANGLLILTLAMQMYLRANSLRLSEVNILNGNEISVAGRGIETGAALQLWPYLYAPTSQSSSVKIISYHDVLHGAVSSDSLSGKIVLLGVTARGLTPAVKTPGGSDVAPVMLAAYTLASMLEDQIISVPAWSTTASMLLLIVIAILLLWLFMTRLKVRIIITAGLVILLLAIEVLLLVQASIWLDVLPAIILLLSGFLLICLMGGEHAPVEKPTAMSGEVHRRVGLASQKRGELDSAFESFRKCPLDNSIMVLLFYLAQDFENANRYERAVAVYQYMESFNPHFKDLQERLEKARMMEDTVMIDESKIAPAVNTAITSLEQKEVSEGESDGQRRLGRYIVEQEIGQGAMGKVFQGRDPKINRTVAIKTLNLKREFDEDEQENVLGRFFHEAEAAGRLHHPHIVTIYDAGEHNELAYIAMEFLTGSDLRIYTKQGTLLPPLTIVKIVMKLAGALAYAHTKGIVHRDIKAANIMYDPSSGQLKITDFGIARLTDSRRTKTGMVLGTPSSMSPEQLRGKKLDGRTDLYSLGVLMFQLLTARLPYKAESLTQLMYKITNEPPPDLFALRPELKDNGVCIPEILNKLLQKDADDRYQDGKKLARDLLACAKKMAGKK